MCDSLSYGIRGVYTVLRFFGERADLGIVVLTDRPSALHRPIPEMASTAAENDNDRRINVTTYSSSTMSISTDGPVRGLTATRSPRRSPGVRQLTYV